MRNYSSRKDPIFKKTVMIMAFIMAGFCIMVFYELFKQSLPSFSRFGWRFVFSSVWDPVAEEYGALPFIYGTVVSSLLALLIAVPMSIGIALYLAEVAPEGIKKTLSFMIELLAAIPSVIYGLWGIFVLIPILRDYIQPVLGRYLGFIPLFSGDFYGAGMLAAGIILSIMIIPTITSISREIFSSVPSTLREASLALGATRWETIKLAVLKYSKTGVIGAVILGLGRALGETMAVTMVIGNRPEIKASLFAPSYTMASVIANEFCEAASGLYSSALIEIGFLLFIVTLALNIIARAFIWSVLKKSELN